MDWLVFGTFILACGGAAASGALFSPGDWYKTLTRPTWTPPDWVFPVVWSSLYVLMSVAAARVAGMPGSGIALGLWAAQLAVNTLWSPVFFGQRRLRAGMGVLIALWVLVVMTTVALFRLDTVAGAMFLPYILWVTIAGALNLWIVRHNRGVQPL
jgi:translocator protein